MMDQDEERDAHEKQDRDTPALDRFRCFADLADQALERLLCAAAKIALDREGGV
jgi:hypothetical protein